MKILKFSTAVAAVSFILSCSAGPNADPPPTPAKTVFDPLTQQMERAREVQKTVDSNTDATRQAVDNQERGDEPH